MKINLRVPGLALMVFAGVMIGANLQVIELEYFSNNQTDAPVAKTSGRGTSLRRLSPNAMSLNKVKGFIEDGELSLGVDTSEDGQFANIIPEARAKISAARSKFNPMQYFSPWERTYFSKGDVTSEILDFLGWTKTDDVSNATIVSIRKRPEKYTKHLEDSQMFNHLDHFRAMTNKGRLGDNLRAYSKKSNHCLSGKTQAESYYLQDPEQAKEFMEKYPAETDNKDTPWIVKPTTLSMGDGMVILTDLTDVRRAITTGRGQFESLDYVVQRYITNPFLLRNRKSEMRVYWLIASVHPLIVLAHEGTVRMNAHEFKLDNWDDKSIHITNVKQQTLALTDEEYSVVKENLKTNWTEMVTAIDNTGVGGPGFSGQLWPLIKETLVHAVNATRQEWGTSPYNRFQILGSDFILDNDGRLFLSELQLSPGISFDDHTKAALIPPMLAGAYDTVAEVHAKRQRGQDMQVLEAVEASGWEVIINEAGTADPYYYEAGVCNKA